MFDTARKSKLNDRVFTQERFDAWMGDSTTRFILSQLPPTGDSELLPTILRAAFDAGAKAGAGAMVIDFMEAMLKPRPPR